MQMSKKQQKRQEIKMQRKNSQLLIMLKNKGRKIKTILNLKST